MNKRTQTIAFRRNGVKAFPVSDFFRLHCTLNEITRAVGERLGEGHGAVWESQSLAGDHLWSRNDLEATGLIFRHAAEVFARKQLHLAFSFENEELQLGPLSGDNGRPMRLIIDPIDGTKEFDNWKGGGDCPVPRPRSAVSLAAVCPFLGEIVASSLYCFDLGEVFSSVCLGMSEEGKPQYAAFRNEILLQAFASNGHGEHKIEAKRRVLSANYNSKALVELARLELALMESGLKPAYGGLSGSSATDIANAVRGSYCACIDARALCGKEGSVPYWYDIAGAIRVAEGRGLRVVVTNSEASPLSGGNHPIFTPVAYVVAHPDIVNVVIGAIRAAVCPTFLQESARRAALPATA